MDANGEAQKSPRIRGSVYLFASMMPDSAIARETMADLLESSSTHETSISPRAPTAAGPSEKEEADAAPESAVREDELLQLVRLFSLAYRYQFSRSLKVIMGTVYSNASGKLRDSAGLVTGIVSAPLPKVAEDGSSTEASSSQDGSSGNLLSMKGGGFDGGQLDLEDVLSAVRSAMRSVTNDTVRQLTHDLDPVRPPPPISEVYRMICDQLTALHAEKEQLLEQVQQLNLQLASFQAQAKETPESTSVEDSANQISTPVNQISKNKKTKNKKKKKNADKGRYTSQLKTTATANKFNPGNPSAHALDGMEHAGSLPLQIPDPTDLMDSSSSDESEIGEERRPSRTEFFQPESSKGDTYGVDRNFMKKEFEDEEQQEDEEDDEKQGNLDNIDDGNNDLVVLSVEGTVNTSGRRRKGWGRSSARSSGATPPESEKAPLRREQEVRPGKSDVRSWEGRSREGLSVLVPAYHHFMTNDSDADLPEVGGLDEVAAGAPRRHTIFGGGRSLQVAGDYGRVSMDFTPSNRPIWVPDSLASNCLHCGVSFTLSRRRHHCRCCGNVYCGACTPHRLALPHFGYDKRVRVCLQCAKNVVPPTYTF